MVFYDFNRYYDFNFLNFLMAIFIFNCIYFMNYNKRIKPFSMSSCVQFNLITRIRIILYKRKYKLNMRFN